MRNIRVFGIYKCLSTLCQGFSRTVVLFTLMLKTTTFIISAKTLLNATYNPSSLTHNTQLAFTFLWQAFTEAYILQNFDEDCYIQIEIYASSKAIYGVPNHFTLDSEQWHLIAFFSRKMMLVETRYKTYNQKLLTIFKAFKTWHHFFKGCKFELFVFINYNNLCFFMDTKN